MPTLSFCGAVLVGGRSARMGRSKARLVVAGQPLWRRQSQRLEQAGARPVFLVLRPGQHSLGGEREIRDRKRDAGPLAGLAAALAASPEQLIAVLAVDLPAMDPAWFVHLLRHCHAGRGAVFRGPRGYEPLAAVYPLSCLASAERRLEGGDYALQDFVRELVRRRQVAAVPLPESLVPMAANWNRPGDWPEAIRRRRTPGR
jgi:molybdopterin-guanine dinucleotide biosynthesis protein A